MNTLALPFTMGETYWLPVTSPQQVTGLCPICLGDRFVTVLIGRAEAITVDCEACGLGYGGPTGTLTEWTNTPGAAEFIIEVVEAMRDGNWDLRSAANQRASFSDLYATETEAVAASERACAENEERNMRTRQQSRQRVKRATWTVQYHRNAIKDLERQITWHRGKITAKRTEEILP